MAPPFQKARVADSSGAKVRCGLRNIGPRSYFQTIVLEATYAFPETREKAAHLRA